MHPVLTAFAENAVAAHSSATNSAWELAWTLQEIQSRTTDHDLCLSCIYSQSFLLHCPFPGQEPSDTFIHRFSYDNKVISIGVLPWDSTAELTWQGFKHNDEKQRAEYRALVNTNLHFNLFTIPLTSTDTAPGIGIHPLDTVALSTHPHQASSVPTKWPSGALGQMLSQGLRKPCKVSFLAARYFSCSCLTTKIASVVPLPGTKPNWESSIDTTCLIRPSTILSRTFMTCSVSLRPSLHNH